MSPVRRLYAAIVLALATLAGIPSLAHAAGEDERILTFTADYVLDADGGASVTETIVYQFPAGTTRHGILRAIVVKQGVQSTPSGSSTGAVTGVRDPQPVDTEAEPSGDYRYYALSDVSATSPSGAPGGVAQIEEIGAAEIIYVGKANKTTSGTQTYVLKYHLANVLNAFADHNELYYNVFGTNDRIPKDSVTVTVTGPGGVSQVACYVGEAGSRTTCPGTPGTTARFMVGAVPAYSALTIVNWLPLGGYGTIAPEIRSASDYSGEPGYGSPSVSESAATTISTLAIGGGVGAPVLAAVGMGLLVRSRGRDEVYADVTPGLTPVPGAGGTVRRGRLGPVAVQFTPPEGVQPGMVGTVIDEEAGPIDVSATVVDLAVRGFLTIEEVNSGRVFARTDWVLTRLTDPAGATLLPYEQALLNGIFSLGNPVNLSDLRTHFAPTLARVRGLMYDEVVQRGWFRRSPESQRAGWSMLGGAVAVVGVITAFMGSSALSQLAHIAGIGVPVALVLGGGLVIAGLVILAFSRAMAWRTADGSAVLAQSRGFREYLVTAEADQIAFEEAQQIFSRYLPYAIVYGVADRWAKVFAQVASAAEAAGSPIVMPTWYVWNGTTFPDFGGIASGAESFSTTAGGTFTATPGSSGGSGFGGGDGGFGGGGGFSGGGVGGSSSGSW
ncbi:MAG: DUF2207 domain-containing protein [Dermatophilaceae bacterium]